MGKPQERSGLISEYAPREDDGVIICRCEEITKGEIRKAVHEGMQTISELRRFLRCGMGLCQGQTCSKLVRGIVAAELAIPQSELGLATSRAPMRPTEMGAWAQDGGNGI